MTLTTLSFDLDDTVWDPRPALIAADKAQWQYLSARFPSLVAHFTKDQVLGCRKEVISAAPNIVGDVTALRIEVMERLLRSLGIPNKTATVEAQAAFSAFMAHRNDVRLFDDAIPILSGLAQEFLLVAITNGNADVHKTPLAPYFELAFRADEVGSAKPDAKIFEIAMKAAGCSAGEMIHIGDSLETDVSGALNAGIEPIWFNANAQENALGVTEVRSLTELPAIITAITS